MKTVIVTGASSGIGKAIYEGYKALNGYRVIGISRRGPDFQINFGNGKGFLEFKEYWEKHNDGTLAILVNAAGIMPLPETLEDANEILNINLLAPYRLTHFLMCRNLCVINISSVSAIAPDEHLHMYGASKAALSNLTASMARRYVGQGARVNCISPGFYDTNLVPGELPTDLLETIPMRKEGNPRDLFKVCKFIEEMEYITGSNIVIDGGVLCKTV